MKFKAIAMQCTEEHFDTIAPKLLKGGCTITSGYWGNNCYLINNYQGIEKAISSTKVFPEHRRREVHEQWDEKVFLEACGIEAFTITKDTVLKYEMKEEFPQLFALESGRWLKNSNYPLWMVYIVGDGSYFGFNIDGDWFNSYSSDSGAVICENILNSKDNSYATIEEVRIKLTNEAEKRGFVKGVKFKSTQNAPFEFTYEYSWFAGDITDMMWNFTGGTVFNKGVWAEAANEKL